MSNKRSRVSTVSPAESTINVRSRSSLPSPLPKLITYDVFEEKSAQHLLFEAAKDQKKSSDRWHAFTDKLESYLSWEKLSKKMVSNLDDKKQWAPLHYAVFHHNSFICHKLTAKASDEKHFQCDINILTGNGENVLHIAARSNQIWTDSSPSNTNPNRAIFEIQIGEETVKLPNIIHTLIERGADINHADDENRTPLHLAVMENRLPFVKYLLDKGANIYAITKLHANVLHFTFIPGKQTSDELTKMFNCLVSQADRSTRSYSPVQKLRNLAQAENLDNKTPLVMAVCHPSITEDIVQRLIFMIEIYPQDMAIHFLVNPSPEEMEILQIQFLMAIGQISRRSFQNYQHLSPIVKSKACDFQTRQQLLHFPCRYDNVSLLKWLLEQPLSNNNLIKSKDNVSMLEGRDHAGYTPLLTAVFYGSSKCVEYLLQNPTSTLETNVALFYKAVDITATNHDGENVLHICAKHHESENVLKLIWPPAVNQGLLKMSDDDGNSPLHVAASNNQTGFCKLAFSLKEPSNDLRFMRNANGQTAAHVATEAMKRRIGPERHHVDKHSSTVSNPSNQKPTAENHGDDNHDDDDEDDDHDFGLPVLRDIWNNAKKGDARNCLFVRDFDRKTCLHLAAAQGQIKIVKFLVEEVGIEIDPIEERRLTPLHLACQYGHDEIVAYLIEHGASTTFRSAELYNCLEIAIMNQKEEIVKELLTLPNWRELMRNAQKIPHTEAYDTPMRKLIRYMPEVTIWMIDRNLTRRLGGQGRHVFKTVYDYEFYADIFLVRKWYAQGANIDEEKETCRERFDRRGCGALCLCTCCCCPTKTSKRATEMLAYTDDAYTLVYNHPLFIAGHQSQCSSLIEHPYNTHLRDRFFIQYGFYFLRVISFLLYAAFLGVFTAVILSGKHPQYFYAKTNRTMTLDLDTCAIVSRNLTAANDAEALKTTTYTNLRWTIYPFLILFVVKNLIPILALFPKMLRSLEYYLEISALVLCYVYVLDWYDWQEPLIFRCPIQYQLGAMGLLLAYFNMLTYVRRIPWFNIGIFVTMLQLIFFKFFRFIPVLMIFICGFGFTYWMLLQNQQVFQSPGEALIRTGFLAFDLGYEEHLYNETYYYKLIFVVTILGAIVFCIFILNLLISLAVGEIPSLTEQGTIWRSEMLYSLLSDYCITALQCVRLLDCLSCGKFRQGIINKLIKGGKRLQPVVVIEHDETGGWYGKLWKNLQKHFFDEKIQDDIKLNKSSSDAKNEEN